MPISRVDWVGDLEEYEAKANAEATAYYEAQCALLTDEERDYELEIMADHLLYDADCELERLLERAGLEIGGLL